jgi:hypothetical protein
VGRRAVAAAVVALSAIGLVAAAVTRTGDSAARASSLGDVVSQVRHSFGDERIAYARLGGSTLRVTLAPAPPHGPGVKAAFEAQVLAAAVAYWMRSYGQKPITAVRYGYLRGRLLSGAVPPSDGEPVPSNPGISSLHRGACRSAAETSVRPPLALASVVQLPYLHGTCVFRFRTSAPVAGSNETMTVLAGIIHRLGDPNERPWLFELVDGRGTALDAASWMPGLNGTTWARPGLSYALAPL